MTDHGHRSVKNQRSPGRYHHKNSACAARFATFGMGRKLSDHANNSNSRGAK